MRKLLLICSLISFSLLGNSQSIYIPSNTNGIGKSSNNRIGIETSTPIGLLDIAKIPGKYEKPFTLSDGSGNLNTFFEYPSTGLNYLIMYMRNHNNINKISINPNGNSYFNGGNVGIGITTPIYPLEVKNENGASNIVSATRNTAGNLIAFTYEDANNDGKFYLRRDAEGTNYTVLSANGYSYFNGGNVGIGTTKPSYPLEVRNKNGASNIISAARNTAGDLIAFTYEDANNDGKFYLRRNAEGTNYTVLSANGYSYFNGGNVGIGTTTPDFLLTVNGTIGAKEIKVTNDIAANGIYINSQPTADFVFEDDYNLRPIEEVESFVNENKHLPEIASAKEMEENGINQAEMNQKLLQKIEELTLYMIEQNKETKAVKVQLNKLADENDKLKEEIKTLKTL